MFLEDIFSLFGFSGGELDKEEMVNDFEGFKDTPQFKLGMFKKLILNGDSFKTQILKFFTSSDDDFDVEGIKDAGRYMMYSRAYFWIQDCKVKSKFWNEPLKMYSDKDFLCAVKMALNYFEEIEEYEKCVVLKKIYDFVKKNLEK